MRGLICALLCATTISLPAASAEAAWEPANHRADDKAIAAANPAEPGHVPLKPATHQPASAGNPADETGNIVIWGIGQEDVQSYFRQNRLMVGPAGKLVRVEDGWEVLMNYPSVNHVDDKPGSTTLYPHRLTIIASATASRQLDSLDLGGIFLILRVVDAEAFRYELVGTAPYEQKAAMDWFAEREALLYRP